MVGNRYESLFSDFQLAPNLFSRRSNKQAVVANATLSRKSDQKLVNQLRLQTIKNRGYYMQVRKIRADEIRKLNHLFYESEELIQSRKEKNNQQIRRHIHFRRQ